MFTSFHANKFRYDQKGQLAPYFIFILVVLIVLAMVTVNLSKVAFIKTDSGNAVDAGGLASGSAMANVFNSVAQANSTLEANYWEFYTEVGILIGIATAYLISAQVALITAETNAIAAEVDAIIAEALGLDAEAAAWSPPAISGGLSEAAAVEAALAAAFLDISLVALADALSNLVTFTRYIWGITISLAAFVAAQQYLYLIIRQTAEKGRRNALTIGHKFLFMNSGIGAKLKEGEADGDPPAPGNYEDPISANYRDSFSDFLKDIKANGVNDEVDPLDGKRKSKYVYQWQDGQDRMHHVNTDIRIDPVDTFDLRVALLPWAAELALLVVILATAYALKADIIAMQLEYGIAMLLYDLAAIGFETASAFFFAAVGPYSCCFNPWTAAVCCPIWTALVIAAAVDLGVALGDIGGGLISNGTGIGLNTAAITLIIPMYVEMGLFLAGLAPAIPFTSSEDLDALPFIICWIDDVKHNRLVEVGTTQYHQGRDFGELWQTKYPDPTGTISSYSITNFTGFGRIHPPNLRFDPSIIETDGSNQQYNSCSYAAARFQQLERDIFGYNGPEPDPANPGQLLRHKGLLESALDCRTAAAELQAQLANSGNSAVLQARITELRAEETRLNNQAQAKINEQNQLVADYPSCTFS